MSLFAFNDTNHNPSCECQESVMTVFETFCLPADTAHNITWFENIDFELRNVYFEEENMLLFILLSHTIDSQINSFLKWKIR
jgi:hypothetical protein